MIKQPYADLANIESVLVHIAAGEGSDSRDTVISAFNFRVRSNSPLISDQLYCIKLFLTDNVAGWTH